MKAMGAPGGDSVGQEGASRVGWWMWHLMDSARGQAVLGAEDKEELSPPWEQGSVGDAPQHPALARVAQPHPLWSWQSPHTTE